MNNIFLMLGLTEDRQMYAPVRVDLMRKALVAFELARQRHQGKGKPWSGKAQDAVSRVVTSDSRSLISYWQRCFAFYDLRKKMSPITIKRFVQADGTMNDHFIDAVALAPLRNDGKFRIKEFAATVERLIVAGPDKLT